MSVALQPLAAGILAVRKEVQNKTTAGLYLPDAAKEKSVVARVIAVGKDVKEVKVGNDVVYKEYSVTEFKIDGEDYLIIKEEDVLAVLAK